MKTGLKFQQSKADMQAVKDYSDELCRAFGLSIIQPTEKSRSYKHYREWKAEKSGIPTIRGMIRDDVERAISQSRNMWAFVERLKEIGYEIKWDANVKYMAVKPPDGAAFIRLKSLGDGYTEEAIAARLGSVRGRLQSIQRSNSNRRLPIPKEHAHKFAEFQPFKYKGWRATYYSWLYLLGKLHRRQDNWQYSMQYREDIRKFDRHVARFELLERYKIETADDLTVFISKVDKKIKELTEERTGLKKDVKSMPHAIPRSSRIAEINICLRKFRRDKCVANEIYTDSDRIREAVSQITESEKQRARKRDLDWER